MAAPHQSIGTLPVEAVYASVASAAVSLSASEAYNRLIQFGANELPEPTHRRYGCGLRIIDAFYGVVTLGGRRCGLCSPYAGVALGFFWVWRSDGYDLVATISPHNFLT